MALGKKLSDAQFIAWWRRFDRWRIWLGAAFTIVGTALFITINVLMGSLYSSFADGFDELETNFQETIRDVPEAEGEVLHTPEMIRAREMVSMLFGWFAGGTAAGGLGLAITGISIMWGDRKTRLLIAYHDRLSQLNALSDQEGNLPADQSLDGQPAIRPT